MIMDYIDLRHEALINYADRICKNMYGVQKIKGIFMNVKNTIQYDNTSLEPMKASETLVMGRGNNFCKTMLLYALLRLNGFQCKVMYMNIIDLSRRIANRNEKAVPWFYVKVNYFGREFRLDCSLDRSYMSAARVTHKSNAMGYDMDHYFIAEGNAFKKVSEEREAESTTEPIFSIIHEAFIKPGEEKISLNYH